MSSKSTAEVRSLLSKANICVSDQWLERCLEYLERELGSNVSIPELYTAVFDQWKHQDLRNVPTGSLPLDITAFIDNEFNNTCTLYGSHYVQIDHMIDVSASAYSQHKKLTNTATVSDEQSEGSNENNYSQKHTPKAQRMLILQLTDGKTEIKAMEYRPIAQLKPDLVLPGAKIRLKGPITCRRGMLLISGTQLEFLGGCVEDLVNKNSQQNILATKIGQMKINTDQSSNKLDNVVNSEINNINNSNNSVAPSVQQSNSSRATSLQHSTTSTAHLNSNNNPRGGAYPGTSRVAGGAGIRKGGTNNNNNRVISTPVSEDDDDDFLLASLDRSQPATSGFSTGSRGNHNRVTVPQLPESSVNQNDSMPNRSNVIDYSKPQTIGRDGVSPYFSQRPSISANQNSIRPVVANRNAGLRQPKVVTLYDGDSPPKMQLDMVQFIVSKPKQQANNNHQRRSSTEVAQVEITDLVDSSDNEEDCDDQIPTVSMPKKSRSSNESVDTVSPPQAMLIKMAPNSNGKQIRTNSKFTAFTSASSSLFRPAEDIATSLKTGNSGFPTPPGQNPLFPVRQSHPVTNAELVANARRPFVTNMDTKLRYQQPPVVANVDFEDEDKELLMALVHMDAAAGAAPSTSSHVGAGSGKLCEFEPHSIPFCASTSYSFRLSHDAINGISLKVVGAENLDVPRLPNSPAYQLLRSVIPTAAPGETYTVKAQIRNLKSKLLGGENAQSTEWKLKVQIDDGTALLDVEMTNALLTKMIGLSVAQAAEVKASKNEARMRSVNLKLAAFKEALINLSSLVQIEKRITSFCAETWFMTAIIQCNNDELIGGMLKRICESRNS